MLQYVVIELFNTDLWNNLIVKTSQPHSAQKINYIHILFDFSVLTVLLLMIVTLTTFCYFGVYMCYYVAKQYG